MNGGVQKDCWIVEEKYANTSIKAYIHPESK